MRDLLLNGRWPVILLVVILTTACRLVSEDPNSGGAGELDKLECTADGVSDDVVVITGTTTFESVPHNPVTNGLNYSAITQKPIRGATVQAVCDTTVYATTITDDTGGYSITVPNKTTITIRVQARMHRTGKPSWDFQVVDNTNSQALYVLDSDAFNSGSADQTLDLNADSGWTGSGYRETRAAAPFAILDAVYLAFNKIFAVDTDVQFPTLLLNWSPSNKPVSGDQTLGFIGTTYYSNNEIYILGAVDNDTDEYDGHVIIHEWGHYLEDNLSRSDSIGGSHGSGDKLDLRIAFSEGFGNAWSGIATDDPLYRDSFGGMQVNGFLIDVENDDDPVKEGWYSEVSIQAILFDIYDSTNDAFDADYLTLGLAPLYAVWTNEQATTPALTSIYSFATELKADLNTNELIYLGNILGNRDVLGDGIYGDNELNAANEPYADGIADDVLPVYTEIFPPGANLASLCSVNDYGEYNKLGNWRFLRFNIAVASTYTITVTGGTDPDFWLYQNGLIAKAEGTAVGTENLTQTFASDDYVLAIADFVNLDQDSTTGGRSCMTVSIQ